MPPSRGRAAHRDAQSCPAQRPLCGKRPGLLVLMQLHTLIWSISSLMDGTAEAKVHLSSPSCSHAGHVTHDSAGHPALKSLPSSGFRCRNAPEVTGFRRLHSGPVPPGMRGPIRIRLTSPPPHTLIYLCPALITSANENTACFLFFNPSHREECTKAWDSSASKCLLMVNEQRSSPTMSHIHLAFKAHKVQGEPDSMSLTLEGPV